MRFLSNKEKKNMRNNLPKGFDFEKKNKITENNNTIYKEDVPFLLYIKNNKNKKDKDIILIPHLKSINKDIEKHYKSVFVDKGAIPFIIKGADLMRPGIQQIDKNIQEEDLILVRDENYKKILAIGKSLFSSENMQKQKKGKSIKILHYVGDDHY